MSSWLDVDDEVAELADDIGEHLGITQERAIKMALVYLALDLRLTMVLPRKEKEHAG